MMKKGFDLVHQSNSNMYVKIAVQDLSAIILDWPFMLVVVPPTSKTVEVEILIGSVISIVLIGSGGAGIVDLDSQSVL